MQQVRLTEDKEIRKKVLIAAPVDPLLIETLSGHGYECIVRETISQATAPALIRDCQGVITSTRLQLNQQLIDAAPFLRWIGRMGSGMEVIDLDYAGQKGIACFSSPEGNCNAVAEHAVGMLLSLIRRITWSHHEVAHGIWRREENRGIELEGKTLAIIGFGHTGAAFARKLQGFDLTLLAYDKYRPESIAAPVVCCNDLARIFEDADIVSFHVPLQSDTIHYLDASFIASMRKPFLLINTSRGAVVDMKAMKDGMDRGKITGACLDVFEHEPLSALTGEIRGIVDELARLPNVIFTPHIAGYTHEALYKMSRVLTEKLSSVL